MSFVLTPYAAFYELSGAIAVFVTVVAWQRRRLPGARAIALMMAVVAWWALFGAVELAAVGIEAKLFWSKICYLGIVAAPVSLLVFAFEFRRMTAWLHPVRLAALCVVPLVTMVLAATNERHGWVWSGIAPSPTGANLAVYVHGPWFWWGVVAYSYVCLAVASLLLVEVTRRFARAHRWRMVTMLAGIALPWIGNLVYIAGWSPWPVDLAPLTMVVTGAVFLWVLVASNLPDLIPFARYRLIEILPDAVLVLDGTDHLVESNPTARRWLGLAASAPLRPPLASLLPPSPAWQGLRDLPAGTRVVIEAVPPFPLHLEAEFVDLRSHEDAPHEGRILVLRDITARKRAEATRLELERRLLHAEKNESLGLFAGGIAHDFNNLMTTVLGRLSLLELRQPPDTSLSKDIVEATRAARRAAELTRQIMMYTGNSSIEQEDVDLASLFDSVAAAIRPALPAGADLQLSVAAALPPLPADSAQIRMACQHLLANALEALPDQRGTVTLAAWAEPAAGAAHPPVHWMHGEPASSRTLVIEVADTGVGMDEATRDQMFEPFFTTKFLGRGLGLAVVWGIVRGHDGCVGVATAPGAGTRVRLVFPLRVSAS